MDSFGRMIGYGKAALSSAIESLNKEWDRLKDAEKELDEPITGKRVETKTVVEKSENPTEEHQPILVPRDPEAQKKYARELLGVPEGAAFEAIREAFIRLNQRSDPSKFPENSPEANRAAVIQRKVHWAYSVLCEGIDDTERRFRSLEI
jgi:hypothetical protein